MGFFKRLASMISGRGTVLWKWRPPGSTEVQRVYVERKGLTAKLWFEQTQSGFTIRHHGDDDDFTVIPVPGEPIYVHEARESFGDLGLDINACTWLQIVEAARERP